jgi:hypothetical protein
MVLMAELTVIGCDVLAADMGSQAGVVPCFKHRAERPLPFTSLAT